jgi:hypothetical protein
MASLEGNRNILHSQHLASGEPVRTTSNHLLWRRDEEDAERPPHGSSHAHCGGSGYGPTGIRLCSHCGAPVGRPELIAIPPNVRTCFPLGPNGGVIIVRRVPGSEEWAAIEHFPPNDERDRYTPVDPLLDAVTAAITLGLSLKTLYARAPYMASSVKHGNRWFFDRDTLLTIDAVSEAPMPSRRRILAERDIRRRRGTLRRAGSHTTTCDRRHRGPCSRSRRAASTPEREAVTRSILNDLGK